MREPVCWLGPAAPGADASGALLGGRGAVFGVKALAGFVSPAGVCVWVGSGPLSRGDLCYLVRYCSWGSSSFPAQEQPPDKASGRGMQRERRRGGAAQRHAPRLSAGGPEGLAGGGAAPSWPGKPAGCQLLEVVHVNAA